MDFDDVWYDIEESVKEVLHRWIDSGRVVMSMFDVKLIATEIAEAWSEKYNTREMEL